MRLKGFDAREIGFAGGTYVEMQRVITDMYEGMPITSQSNNDSWIPFSFKKETKNKYNPLLSAMMAS